MLWMQWCICPCLDVTWFSCLLSTVPKLQMKFSIRNMCPIEGEANVARFLFKLLAPYPNDPALATLVDQWVDVAFFQLAEGSAKEHAAVLRALNSALGRNPWVVGPEFSLADIACYCCMLSSGSAPSAPANVQRWVKSCENLGHFSPAKGLVQWLGGGLVLRADIRMFKKWAKWDRNK